MQTETLDLVVINKLNSSELFRIGIGVDELIEYVKTRAYEVPQDVSTPESRAAMKSQAYLISKCKRPVEDAKKRESAELKKQTKAIDANGKKIVDAISAIQDEYRLPLTEWEDAEKAREEAEKLAIEIEMCHEDAIEMNETHDKLKELERIKAEQAEKEAQEAARIAAEKAERERLEREERLKAEAAEKARLEAEQRIKDAEAETQRQKEAAEAAERAKAEAEAKAKREAEEANKRAEAARIQAVKDAEAKAKAEADQKERDRLAKEKADKDAAERKAANSRHRQTIQRKVVACFMAEGLSDIEAEKVLWMIDGGKIENVTINY